MSDRAPIDIGAATVSLTSPPPGSPPPVAGARDVARLVVTLAAELVRERRGASMRRAFRRWAARTATRLDSPDFVLKLGSRSLLLAGGAQLSRCLLHATPGDGIGAGHTKRDAMQTLAPLALTVSDGADWRRRRAFVEATLQPDRLHEAAEVFVARTRVAFDGHVETVEDLRDGMRRAMLGVVLGAHGGGGASERTARDVEALFALVQSPPPLRRMRATLAERRLVRVHAALRTLWHSTTTPPSLIATARAQEDGLGEEEALDQLPHWMFTFTGSGTELLARTLALVLSHPRAHQRISAELAHVDDGAAALDALPFLEACLVETAHLYPPVGRTFHRTSVAQTMAGHALPADLEVLQLLPPLDDAEARQPRRFRPERHLGGVPQEGFDPFLDGARRCPGRRVILLVCKAAIAELVQRRAIALTSPTLARDALPDELSLADIRFTAARPA